MDTINKLIKPFNIVEFEGNYSLLLNEVGKYKQAIFNLREEEGCLGNGYDWEALATAFINDHNEYGSIEFDSEAGLFCAYDSDLERLKDFAYALKAICDNEEDMKDLLMKSVLI